MELGFGGGSITQIEWDWIAEKCKSLNVKTFLEIGSGYSTTLFMKIVDHIDSYETSDSFINELLRRVDQNKVTIVKYVYPNFPINNKRYDAALVDGPGQNNNNGRMNSMMFVEPLTDYVFIHDFSRRGEKSSREAVFRDEVWEVYETKSRTILLKRRPDAPRTRQIIISNTILQTNEQTTEVTQCVSESSVRCN